jgi:quinol monooxygenase YgiN
MPSTTIFISVFFKSKKRKENQSKDLATTVVKRSQKEPTNILKDPHNIQGQCYKNKN